MTPDEYCQQKAAQSGSSFYYSFLFLPPERRRAITALYAFCREVDDVVDEVTDPDVARTKLAWWRQEIAAAFAGTPQHPVAQALQPASSPRYALPQEHFQAVIDGMQMDLDATATSISPTSSATATASPAWSGCMSAEIFGCTQAGARCEYARDLGIAFQLTNIIRDVGEDARRGRIYLPQDELARFGVAAGCAAAARGERRLSRADGRQVDARARVVRRARWPRCPTRTAARSGPGLIMAAIYRTLLDEIERDGYRVLDQRIALTPLRKLWIAWKTARSA